MPQVRLIARRIHERLPACVGLDDLVSTGILGLIRAIDNYEPCHNVKLKTYAEYKIRGAILDGLRELDWAPRQKRKRAKQIESAIAAAEQRLHREPTEAEIATELNVSVNELHGWLVEVRAVNLSLMDVTTEAADSAERLPSRIVEKAELQLLLDRAIASIPEIERLVIRMYYKEDLTLRDIAKIARLHESRISQLKTQAIARVSGYIRKRWPAGRPGPQ